MVVIRLTRRGAKKRPFYHVTVADQRYASDGRQLERLGFFNPLARGLEERLRLDLERLEMWCGRGAKMSDCVRDLVREARLSDEDLARRQQVLAGRAERRAERRRAAREAAAVGAGAQAAPEEDAPDTGAELTTAEADEPAQAAGDAAESDGETVESDGDAAESDGEADEATAATGGDAADPTAD